jgi:hypothetical protein
MVQKVDYLLLVFILINIYFCRIAGLCNNLEKASLVSYDLRASSRHTTQLSSSYDPKAGTSYFDQRFTDRTAIGKGSFSTVIKNN